MATTRTKAETAAETAADTAAPAPGAGTFEDPAWPAEPEQVYPVGANGLVDTSAPLYPGDDLEFVLSFLERLAPEQFDRARQQFMQSCNDERGAA